MNTNNIKLISTGEPSTLGTYRRIAEIIGEKAVQFIDTKIAESEKGADEIVLTDESEMLLLLASIGWKDLRSDI